MATLDEMMKKGCVINDMAQEFIRDMTKASAAEQLSICVALMTHVIANSDERKAKQIELACIAFDSVVLALAFGLGGTNERSKPDPT